METSGSSNLTGTPFRELTSDGTNGIYYVPENSGTDTSRVPLNALVNCTQTFDKEGISPDNPKVVAGQPMYEVDGVKFEFTRQNGIYYLKHPKCSLVGMGKTLLEVETDLKYQCGIIVKEFNDIINDIIPLNMVNWVFRNAIYNYMQDGKCKCSLCQ